ncbi:TELO2-interacting protein 2 [Hemicordylus capensis]|uniref:TELO2-interacting protein 2 n=1 Tax=Hemicordylus capensis TaxID=884348 RepID=UPI002304A720|nr:TELO2-interacting protein 2 [Hemicordylus capensis]
MEQRHLLDSLPLASSGTQQDPSKCPTAEQVLPQFLQLFASKGAQQAGSKAQAGMVRDLLAILEAVDCHWLFGDCPPKATPTVLSNLVAALIQYGALPQQEAGGGELSSDHPAFSAAAEQAADASQVFRSLLAKVTVARNAKNLGAAAVDSVLHQVAGPVYVFAVTHTAKKPWSRPRTRSRAQELLEDLLQASGCQSVPEFLRGARGGEEGWFAEVMQCLKPELTKETWQRNPATKHVFSWTLQQVTRPWLSLHLEKVLPLPLLLSDDYRVENKILGVQCLHHIVCNVPAAELCQFNRAQVLYHAIFNHLYSKEAKLVQVVLLCLLDLLAVLEKAPQWLSHKPPSATPSEEVLRLVLTQMEVEHRLSLRRVYAQNLTAFVERLGIQIARHLKKLQPVIVGYLEIADGPEEAARLATLETLKQTIQHAWPRMSCHLDVLLKALLKLMWDVATDRSQTPDSVRASLLQGATECLLLLDRCSHGQVKTLLQGVYRCCQDEHMKDYLRKVQEEPTRSLSYAELKRDDVSS